MPAKKYVIALSEAERVSLGKVSASNRRSVREKTRARILLRSDSQTPHEVGGSCTDDFIASQFKVSALTVANVRQRACERGALESVTRQEQGHRKARKLDGAQEAHLVAVACSTPPEGAATWTLRLLRARLIELEVVEHIGLETIRTTLKKTRSSRG
jgi:transposase